MWAVLPIKDMDQAKQRLSPALSAPERQGLFAAMAEDVLAALAAVPAFDGILVVTRDRQAADLARRYGARVLGEPENRGQTAAVSLAAETLRAEGAAGMLAVPGDIPLITAAEILAVLAAHAAAPSVTIVPAWDERGSNCMVCSSPGVIPFSFGNDSFQPHQASCRAAGIVPRILPLPGIALDIDNPVELRMLLARPGDTRAHAYLRDKGITERMAREPELVKG